MDRLDLLEELATQNGIIIDYSVLRKDDALDGLFIEFENQAIILINAHRDLQTRTVALAEELGHFHRSYGNSLSLETVAQQKSENDGRAWSYNELLPPDSIRRAVRSGICTIWELAEKFSVPDSFVRDAIQYYQQKSILSIRCGWCEVG